MNQAPNKEWARKLIARWNGGENLLRCQIVIACDALGIDHRTLKRHEKILEPAPEMPEDWE